MSKIGSRLRDGRPNVIIIENRWSEMGRWEELSAGSLVWVRRRNGSWWPGKILGEEEVSASLSHVAAASSKSGTPVKLLGREDASVDWYNLEKSKRVKAFRCGEFDDCINKVDGASSCTRRREKYACREDAIIHALQLEREKLVPTILKELPSSSPRLLAHGQVALKRKAFTSSIPGEKEQTGVIVRAKRTQCVYLQLHPNANLDRTQCPSQQMHITATLFGVNNCHNNPVSLLKENNTLGFMPDSSTTHQNTDQNIPSGMFLQVSIIHL